MADITHTSTGNFSIGFDWDDSAGSGEYLSVAIGSNGPPDSVRWESALMTLVDLDKISRDNGAIEFRNNSTLNLVNFKAGATQVMHIDSDGKIWASGFVTAPVSSAPSGSGLIGEVRVQTGAANGKLWFNVDGGTTWKSVSLN